MTQAVNVVVGIIVRGNLILLCQRRPGQKYELRWEFPGGKVEIGETNEEALVRELREEVNTVPRSWRQFRSDRNVYSDGGTFEVVYYIVDAFDGEPENVEFNDIVWVPPAELDKFDILEGNRKVCRQLQELYNSSTTDDAHV